MFRTFQPEIGLSIFKFVRDLLGKGRFGVYNSIYNNVIISSLIYIPMLNE
jgi:uncharacterized protein YbcI